MNNITIEEYKSHLIERFTEIALDNEELNNGGCGCGSGCGCHTSEETNTQISDPGYHSDADLGLGTGRPTRFAGIKEGDTVVDLGCGAGVDSFLARGITGVSGKVIGIDITGKMVEKSRKNADAAGYNNVEFRLGDVEDIPVGDKSAQVVIGNGVLSLTPDTEKALAEAYRILKHHGSLCVSDIMVRGDMPAKLKIDIDLFTGSMAGSMNIDDFIAQLQKTGFEEIEIKEELKIELPDAMLNYYLPPDEAKEFREGASGAYSVVLTAEKPCCHAGEEDHVCCGNH